MITTPRSAFVPFLGHATRTAHVLRAVPRRAVLLVTAVLATTMVVATQGLAATAAASPLSVTATAQFAPWSLGSVRYDAAHHALWALQQDATGTWDLLKLDRTSLAVVHSTPLAVQGQAYYDLAIGLDRVWVSNFPNDSADRSLVSSISEYDSSGAFIRTISTYGHGASGATFLDGRVWVANHHQDAPGTGGSVVELDPDTGALLARVPAGAPIFCCGPSELAVADGALWAGVPNLNGVVRIDPSTLSTTLISGGGGGGVHPQGSCGGFAVDAPNHRIWATDAFCGPSSILAIDTVRGVVTRSINAGGVAAGIAFGDGSLWAAVADNGQGSSGFVVQLDPGSGQVEAKLSIGGWGDVAFGDGAAYVESLPTGQILRVTD